MSMYATTVLYDHDANSIKLSRSIETEPIMAMPFCFTLLLQMYMDMHSKYQIPNMP